ncbi:MAG TPA: ATP-binding cassette domain-containing protein [Candidatus Mailhella merdavium]|nr:ATP-binding cassette domain-containing protein [Candidatus Mailhella merdavium]
MGFLELHEISVCYGRTPVLKPTDLDVEQGEFLCLLGPSGCGKTSLLNCIAGIVEPATGTVRLDGRDITHEAPERRRCGMVFQSYALFPNLCVADNIAYGLRGAAWPRSRRNSRVAEMLELVGLKNCADRRPAQLSGGEQQRVALARALAPVPSVLLLDEPLSALDARVRIRLGEELRALQRRIGVTTVMVTHDQQEALALADRIVVMGRGHVEQTGTPEEIWRTPQTLSVARFVGDMNFFIAPGTEKGKICGIRYEDVRVLEATELSLGACNTWAARVEAVHYMGKHVRLLLLLQDYATRIHADLSPSEALPFAVRDLVAVRLPQDLLRIWDCPEEEDCTEDRQGGGA